MKKSLYGLFFILLSLTLFMCTDSPTDPGANEPGIENKAMQKRVESTAKKASLDKKNGITIPEEDVYKGIADIDSKAIDEEESGCEYGALAFGFPSVTNQVRNTDGTWNVTISCYAQWGPSTTNAEYLKNGGFHYYDQNGSGISDDVIAWSDSDDPQAPILHGQFPFSTTINNIPNNANLKIAVQGTVWECRTGTSWFKEGSHIEQSFTGYSISFPVKTLSTGAPLNYLSIDGSGSNGGTYYWDTSTTHTVTAASYIYPNEANMKYVFKEWSDGDTNRTKNILLNNGNMSLSVTYIKEVDGPGPIGP